MSSRFLWHDSWWAEGRINYQGQIILLFLISRILNEIYFKQWFPMLSQLIIKLRVTWICSCVYVHFIFPIISSFLKSRNWKCPAFSILRSLIIHSHQNVSPKLWKNEKDVRSPSQSDCSIYISVQEEFY